MAPEMRALFVHQTMPGQFRHLSARWAAAANQSAVFITQHIESTVPGVRPMLYAPGRAPAESSTHRYLHRMERCVLNGQEVARVALELQEQGFRPDVMVAHHGWGEALYLKDVFPDVPLVCLFEIFHRPEHITDVPDLVSPDIESRSEIRTRNLVSMMSLDACDAGLVSTQWQFDQFPQSFAHKLSVLHEGIDTEACRANPVAALALPGGRVVRRSDEVITFVSRSLEPHRGFASFMRAAAEICRRRPNAQILVIGNDGHSYSPPAPDGTTYRNMIHAEAPIDPDRIHFLGKVPYETFRSAMQVSSAHAYFSIPFILSWSVLEAMAAECVVIGSDNASVREVIDDGYNGLLVDPTDAQCVADRVDEVLDHPDRMRAVREAARHTVVERYGSTRGAELQHRFLHQVIDGNANQGAAPRRAQGASTAEGSH